MRKKKLLLASSSKSRKQLLQQLGIHFEISRPDVDETANTGESGEDLVRRLSYKKAASQINNYSDYLILGADQVAVLNHKIYGKPENHQTAVQYLQEFRNRTVKYLSAFCLLDPQTGEAYEHTEHFSVVYRPLTDAQIDRYLSLEQPYQCAGGLKFEGIGIALLEKTIGEDPTAVLGLPLMQVCTALARFGVEIV